MTTTRRHCLTTLGTSLLAPAFVRHARAADTPRFTLGVASGTPRPDGLVLWTRLTGEALPDAVPVRWEVAHDDAFTRLAAQGTFIAHADDAHSVHAELRGLAPDRGYWYRFTALGQRSTTGRTRTAPARSTRAGLRFAIASCQRWDHGHYAAWRDAAEQAAADRLDLLILVGATLCFHCPPLLVATVAAKRLQVFYRVNIPLQALLQDSVHQHIGVSPYGRGKMAIMLKSQPIMAYILGSIYRLRHSPYPQLLQHMLLRVAPHGFQHLVKRPRYCCRRTQIEPHPKPACKQSKYLQLVLIRHIMHPVWEGHYFTFEPYCPYIFGNSAVGQQHKFFN